MPKIVIIGGGSVVWTKNIVGDLCLLPSLHGSEIVLVDINEERLGSAVRLAERISRDTGAGLTIAASMDRAASLRGAEFVIISISVGGNEAWLQDIEIPWKNFGIMQTVGDTTGPGGIFRFFRHFPVMLEIARDIQRICPEAWTIQLTNPMTPLCRAIEKVLNIKMVGYCHGVNDTEHYLARDLGLNPEQIKIYGYGVNHFLFVHSLLIDGKPGMPVLERYEERLREKRPSIHELWKAYGLFPINNDRHPSEFVPFFLKQRNGFGADFKLNQEVTYEHIGKSQDMVRAIEAELESDAPLSITHSYENIAEIMEAIHCNKDFVVHLNIPNKGAIANLPLECNVEVPALVNARGYHPLVMGELPRGLDSLVRRIAEEQELMVEAVLADSKELAVRALAMDPLIEDIRTARQLMDCMQEAQKQWMPEFK